MRVLAVDDNATNRELLATHLSGAGMVCHTVSDGRTAIQALLGCADSAPYALAILDQNMPRMTGRELARLIQQEPQLRGLRLILIGSVGRTLGENEREELGSRRTPRSPFGKSSYSISSRAHCADPTWLRVSAPPEVPSEEPPNRARASTFCCVEDSPINAEVAGEDPLRVAGYTFDSATDGLLAIEATLAKPYDLIPDGLLPARTRRL